MENLKENLEQDIKKIVGVLKDEEELVEVLRRRLTKKEWKYYKLKIEDATNDMLKQELNCDDERLEEIAKQTILKLNQEKIKQELVD